MTKEFKLTRQGVRNLDALGVKVEARILPPDCDHRAMDVCCYVVNKKGKRVPCGHWVCRKCGCDYDESFDGAVNIRF